MHMLGHTFSQWLSSGELRVYEYLCHLESVAEALEHGIHIACVAKVGQAY